MQSGHSPLWGSRLSELLADGSWLARWCWSRGRLPGRKSSWLPSFSDLLPPHGEVESLPVEQVIVPARFDDSAALENVDAVGVHDCRQPVGNENRHRFAIAGNIAHRAADFFFC